MLELTANEIANLLESHRKELQSFLCRRVSCSEVADDIMQDMFLRLLRSRSTEPVDNPRAFLYRVAANLATDYLRSLERQTARRAGEEAIASVPDATPLPDAALFSREQVERLKRAVAELPPRRREVFILCKFEQLTYVQAAKKLGISESSVIKHMVKALEHCRQRVMEDSL